MAVVNVVEPDPVQEALDALSTEYLTEIAKGDVDGQVRLADDTLLKFTPFAAQQQLDRRS